MRKEVQTFIEQIDRAIMRSKEMSREALENEGWSDMSLTSMLDVLLTIRAAVVEADSFQIEVPSWAITRGLDAQGLLWDEQSSESLIQDFLDIGTSMRNANTTRRSNCR